MKYIVHNCIPIVCFAILLIFNPIELESAWAQSVLERLENQIRQNVSPSQQGQQPHKASATPSGTRSALQPFGTKPSGDKSFNALQAGTHAEQGYLGATVEDKKDRGRGVRIDAVRSGGPADQGGLRKQDLIVALGGIRIRQMSDLTDVLSLYVPDDVVEFEIIRDGNPQKIKVTLGRRHDATVQAGQGAETIPLPPGELIPLEPPPVEAPPALISPNVNEPPALNDKETIKQLQGRVVELEQQVQELERELSESQKKK